MKQLGTTENVLKLQHLFQNERKYGEVILEQAGVDQMEW